MLTTTRAVNDIFTSRLVQLWAERYLPDLSSVKGSLNVMQLVEVASLEGRAKTVTKLKRLLKIDCEYAGIETNDLFSYIPKVVNLTEAKRLALCVSHIYEKALFVYQQQSPPLSLLTALTSATVPSESSAVQLKSDITTKWALPLLEQLMMVLDPMLQQLRERYLLSIDPRTIGFFTTQFHFSTHLILKQLTPCEQVLIKPYFRFIEEQVCIPLQRCELAARDKLGSANLALVEQLIPTSRNIAKTVYRQAALLHRKHQSRRGELSHPGVMASTLRDLEMFQSYLWLCLLEESIAPIEQELLPLCIMVFPSIQVTWELVQNVLKLLVDEIQLRVQPEQRQLLLTYTQPMLQLFANF